MLASLLSLALLALPPPTDYEQARAELLAAVENANSDAEAGLERLSLALLELARYSEQLVDDPTALAQRTEATLTLARAQTSAGHDQLALETMDRALREAGRDPLPVERFGPRTRALHDQRRAALIAAGYSSVKVDCEVECRVYVDEREVSNPSPPLWLGPRRILVRAVDGELESESWTLALAEPDQQVTLRYPPARLIEHEPEPSAPSKSVENSGPAPLLASGGTMLAGGVALTAFGISWWARQPETVFKGVQIVVLDYRPPGKALFAAGLASLTLGATLLALELVRARRQQRRQIGLDVTSRYVGLRLSGRF